MSDDDPKRRPELEQTYSEHLSNTSSTAGPQVEVRAPNLADPVIGANISGYVVKSRLGVGGMGIVYEGHHEVIGKRAAIKVLRPELAEDPAQLERLVAEARAVNQVGHRGIIDVFAYGQLPDGRQCIVMEFLDGQPLEELLKQQKKKGEPLPVAEVLEILDEVLSALNAAHSANVVHRDLKPSNIFLVRQRDARFVKLLDFGVAKLGALGGSTPVSRASMIAGTPTYMAPEQARGAAAAPTMDLYSVGIMAFEMLCNQPPFDADSVMGMLMMHAETPPRKPSQLRSEIPDALDELVLRLLAKKPLERFRSAEHVRAEVVRLKAHLRDPAAPRTLQDESLSSVQSEILAFSQEIDPEKLKATMMKPVESAAEPAADPPPPAGNPGETMVLPKRPVPTRPRPAQMEEPPPGTSQILPSKPRWPVFLLSAGAGALLIGAAWLAFSPHPQPTKPTPTADAPPAPKAPQVVAKRDAPVVQPAPAEPAPAPAEPAPAPAEAPVPAAKPSPASAELSPPPPPPTPPPEQGPRPVRTKTPLEPAMVRVAPAPPPPPRAAVQSSGLLGRLKKLEARLDAAQKGGGEVGLYLKQVQRIRQKLEAGPLSPDDRTRVEVALDNLEKGSDY